MLFKDVLLMMEAINEHYKKQSLLLRHQTALICEAFIGNGKGISHVMNSWRVDEQETGLTQEDIRALLKRKREKDELRRLKNK